MSSLPITRAIISVWDKTGVIALARELFEWDVEILSTGGTARKLREHNIPVIEVATFTGYPEIFDGRVKTLHPRLEGAIIFDREKHTDEAKKLDIPPVDLVVVNLYPFETVTADPNCSVKKAIENIDIGGPTMIRAAAKNNSGVAVATNPSQYNKLIGELRGHDGCIRTDTRFRWAIEAFALCSHYDGNVHAWLAKHAPE